jgi:transposase InsO family protein
VSSAAAAGDLRAARLPYIGQARSTQRKSHLVRDDEAALGAAVIRLASAYGRYGYRRITALLRADDWRVNAKRVQRIWRREGLKVPARQPKRGRLPPQAFVATSPSNFLLKISATELDTRCPRGSNPAFNTSAKPYTFLANSKERRKSA